MGWAKFDDRWPTHPKLMAAGKNPTEVLEAKALDASGICYSAGQETDGFIPDSVLVLLAAGHRRPRSIADRLVAVGRWIRDEERKGYVIHDYLVFNESRASARARRAVKQEAGRKGGLRSGSSRRGSTSEAGASADASANGQADAPPLVEPPPEGAATSLVELPTRSNSSISVLNHHGVGPASAEKDRKTEPDDPVSDRLLGLWPGRRQQLKDAKDVLTEARRWLDESLIDEVVGHMVSMRPAPSSPRYLATVAADWAVQRGAYPPSHEAIESLRSIGKSRRSA